LSKSKGVEEYKLKLKVINFERDMVQSMKQHLQGGKAIHMTNVNRTRKRYQAAHNITCWQ